MFYENSKQKAKWYILYNIQGCRKRTNGNEGFRPEREVIEIGEGV